MRPTECKAGQKVEMGRTQTPIRILTSLFGIDSVLPVRIPVASLALSLLLKMFIADVTGDEMRVRECVSEL